MVINFEQYQHFYLIGIKGAGMTAVAEILSAQGKDVSGSDVGNIFFTDALLQKRKIFVKRGFSAENISSLTEVVIYSTAYTDQNEEVAAAKKRGLITLTYPEALGSLALVYKSAIAISGTHGKSTITALVTWLLASGGKNPTAVIGARANNLMSNARIGSEKIFIFEADEYQNKFQHYRPTSLLVNNIEYDHPDWFKTKKSYVKAFTDFINKISVGGYIVANADDLTVSRLVQRAKAKVIFFGEKNPKADWQLKARRSLSSWGQEITIYYQNKLYGQFYLPLIGRHNALNATAAIALIQTALAPGLTKAALRQGLKSFKGTVRRLEKISAKKNILIIDDYAHHPGEIVATLAALKEQYPNRRLICIFQPHTYSRTKALLSQFATAFELADRLILVDIYASAREKSKTITLRELATKVKMNNQHVLTAANIKEASIKATRIIKPLDVVVTMGAGDTWQVAQSLKKYLAGAGFSK